MEPPKVSAGLAHPAGTQNLRNSFLEQNISSPYPMTGSNYRSHFSVSFGVCAYMHSKDIYQGHQVSQRTFHVCMVSVFVKVRKHRHGGWSNKFLLRKPPAPSSVFQTDGCLFLSPVYPGNLVLPPGASLGIGLTPEAARELGLPSGIAVAASLIDAHAGGLGNFSTPCQHQLCGFSAHTLLPRT